MKKLEEQLAKLVEKGIELAEKTGEFVIREAPELLREFYTWGIVKNSFVCVVSILVMWVFYMLLKSLGRKTEKKRNYHFDSPDVKFLGRYYESETLFFTSVFGGLFVLLPAFIALVIGIYNILFIIVAPKLYLINYFVK